MKMMNVPVIHVKGVPPVLMDYIDSYVFVQMEHWVRDVIVSYH